MLRFSCLPNKALFVSWPYYHSCRFPNKGNVPRKGFFPHRGRKLSGVSLTDGRGVCRAYGHGSQPALPSPSGRSLFNLPRSQPPPSGVVPRSAEGTRRRPKQAARWGRGAPHQKGRGNCCPHPGRTTRLSVRKAGWTPIKRLRTAYWNSAHHPALPHQNRHSRPACA